jgi:hypothetical protein
VDFIGSLPGAKSNCVSSNFVIIRDEQTVTNFHEF